MIELEGKKVCVKIDKLNQEEFSRKIEKVLIENSESSGLKFGTPISAGACGYEEYMMNFMCSIFGPSDFLCQVNTHTYNNCMNNNR